METRLLLEEVLPRRLPSNLSACLAFKCAAGVVWRPLLLQQLRGAAILVVPCDPLLTPWVGAPVGWLDAIMLLPLHGAGSRQATILLLVPGPPSSGPCPPSSGGRCPLPDHCPPPCGEGHMWRLPPRRAYALG